jgi:hypothetical protein
MHVWVNLGCKPGFLFLQPLCGISWGIAMLNNYSAMNETLLPPLDRAALCRRLSELHAKQAYADPSALAMRIGIEDADGELVHVVETPSLSEAVRVFELLGEYGLEPRGGRHRTQDGRRLTRLYAPHQGR